MRQAARSARSYAEDPTSTFERVAETVIEVKHAGPFRELLRRIRKDSFDDNNAAMGRAFDLTGAYIGDVLLEKRGVGIKLLRAISRLTGHSLEDLIDGVALEPDPYPARARAVFCARTAAHAVQQGNYTGAEGRSVEWWMRRLREEQDKALEALEQSESPAEPIESAVHRRVAVGDDT